MVAALVKAGADIKAHDGKGGTPLQFAEKFSKNPAVVAALRKAQARAGAEVNARDGRGGWTPLHLAAWFGKSPAVVKALLDAGADPEARDKAGKTPRDYAKANPALKRADLHGLLAGVSCED